MAKATPQPITDTDSPYSRGQSEIIIERREVIAKVELHEFGNVPPLVAAFGEIGTWMANGWDGMEPCSVEFTFNGCVFVTRAEPPIRETRSE